MLKSAKTQQTHCLYWHGGFYFTGDYSIINTLHNPVCTPMPVSALSSVVLDSEAATLRFGAALATCLPASLVVWLEGDLGAGKTTLVRGILRGLGYQGAVKSPTYTLVERYDTARGTVSHFDLYRFTTPEEWLDAGLDELIDGHSVVLIEWPRQAEGFAPTPDLTITLTPAQTGRILTAQIHTPAAQPISHALSDSSWQN